MAPRRCGLERTQFKFKKNSWHQDELQKMNKQWRIQLWLRCVDGTTSFMVNHYYSSTWFITIILFRRVQGRSSLKKREVEWNSLTLTWMCGWHQFVTLCSAIMNVCSNKEGEWGGRGRSFFTRSKDCYITQRAILVTRRKCWVMIFEIKQYTIASYWYLKIRQV